MKWRLQKLSFLCTIQHSGKFIRGCQSPISVLLCQLTPVKTSKVEIYAFSESNSHIGIFPIIYLICSKLNHHTKEKFENIWMIFVLGKIKMVSTRTILAVRERSHHKDNFPENLAVAVGSIFFPS